jgi:hypothetical protein
MFLTNRGVPYWNVLRPATIAADTLNKFKAALDHDIATIPLLSSSSDL